MSNEWAIRLIPRSKTSEAGCFTLAYLPDKESAQIDCEGYAEMIELSGAIPGSFEAHPSRLIPCAVVRRMGKATWLIRTDAFERETETGYDQGYGYLKVEEVWT